MVIVGYKSPSTMSEVPRTPAVKEAASTGALILLR
jgi:hypothetical protein